MSTAHQAPLRISATAAGYYPVHPYSNLVTHEMVHNLQQRADGTLLSAAIREGMADFVAELVTGSMSTNARLPVYGSAHERELWQAFRQEMQVSATKNWLANPEQETADKPCDLGRMSGRTTGRSPAVGEKRLPFS